MHVNCILNKTHCTVGAQPVPMWCDSSAHRYGCCLGHADNKEHQTWFVEGGDTCTPWCQTSFLVLPSAICVAVSTPDFAGINIGVCGRSKKASVCVVLSVSGTTSVSSSRYTSVCRHRQPSRSHKAPHGVFRARDAHMTAVYSSVVSSWHM